MIEHLILIFLSYILLGAFSGMVFGVLGVGGGLIAVPGLAYLFQLENFSSPNVMHLAVGTSLAVMVFTTIRAIFSHRHHGIEFWYIFHRLLPGLFFGVVGGAVLGHFLHSRVIAIIFGVCVILIAMRMFLMKAMSPKKGLPNTFGMGVLGGVAGLMSGLLGLGGGIVTIPYLTYRNVAIREAVLVSVATALTVSILGTILMMITGSFSLGLPRWSTGYVYWPACIGVAIGTLIFVPLGVSLSYRLPVHTLKRVFAVFLLLVGVHLLFGP